MNDKKYLINHSLAFILSLVAQVWILILTLTFFTCSVVLVCEPKLNIGTIIIGVLFLINDYFYLRTYILQKGKVFNIVKYINYLLAIAAVVLCVIYLKSLI